LEDWKEKRREDSEQTLEDNEIKMVSLECLCCASWTPSLDAGFFTPRSAEKKTKPSARPPMRYNTPRPTERSPFFGSAHPPKNLHSDLKAVLVLGRGVVARLVAKVEPVDRERKSAAAKAIQ